MILLSDATKLSFVHLVAPPTHAFCTSVIAVYEPYGGLLHLNMQYEYGSLDANSIFVKNAFITPAFVQMPDPNGPNPVPYQFAVLHALFDAGVAPTPGDPSIPISAPNKGAGDYKHVDLDNVAADANPGLGGVSITYSGAIQIGMAVEAQGAVKFVEAYQDNGLEASGWVAQSATQSTTLEAAGTTSE
jgi:hypothetical protein